MLDFIGYALGIVWLLSPIVLFILFLTERGKRKRQLEMLKKLYLSGRISTDELHLSCMPVPPEENTVLPPGGISPPVGAPGFVPPPDQLSPIFGPLAQVPQSPPAPDVPAEVPAPTAVPAAEMPAPEVPKEEPVAEPAEPELSVGKPAAESPAPEFAPALGENGVSAPIVQQEPVYQSPPEVIQSPQYDQPAEPPSTFQVSSISAMLSVGVVLVVVAALVMVGAAWGMMSNLGRLGILAFGSVVFFGSSVACRRIGKLERTAMALFSIGAAYLPISVWAAGNFKLLGEGLSGATNPWLLMLSCSSFTAISAAAVRIYRKNSWGVGVLCSLSLAYIFFARAVTNYEGMFSIFLLLVSAYAAVLVYITRAVREHLPLPVASVLEPFAVCYQLFVSLLFLVTIGVDTSKPVTGLAAFICASAYLAPLVTSYLKEYTGVPMGLMTLLGFGMLFYPLYSNKDIPTGMQVSFEIYASMTLAACAAAYILMLLTNVLPEKTRSGFRYMSYVFAGLSMFVHLFSSKVNLMTVITTLALLVLLILLVRITPGKPICLLPNAAAFMLIRDTAYWLHRTYELPDSDVLMLAGAFSLLAFCGFLWKKRLRTIASDVLFPCASSVVFMIAALCAEDTHPSAWVFWLSLAGIVCAEGILLWLSLNKGSKRRRQHIYALLAPIVLLQLMITAVNAYSTKFTHAEQDVWDGCFICLWAAAAVITALVVYIASPKEQFRSVRCLLTAGMLIPPVITAFIADEAVSGWFLELLMLLVAGGCAVLYAAAARRDFRVYAYGGCITCALLLSEVTFYSVHHRIFDSVYTPTSLMVAMLWMIALGILGIVTRKRIWFFRGSHILANTAEILVPLASLGYALAFIDMPRALWANFYFVYAVILCVVGWFATSERHVIMPAFPAFALICAMEGLRHFNTGKTVTNLTVVLMIAAFAAMTLLFPYLGIVLREVQEDTLLQRRTWVLTGMGAFIPLWMLYFSHAAAYSHKQSEWLVFFVPVLLAGYLVHFKFVTQDESTQKLVLAFAAGLCTIALWIQPLFSVDDTYWENKLHLLPLIGFGVAIRYLYGKATGSGFLFIIGCYSMLRLGFSAIATETAADLLTVLTVALAIFIVSFYVKQKRWFLLGGVSLLVLSFYITMKMSDGLLWWAYLLVAGIILIAVAASNELMKANGDSLKERAGRLWEDWKW